jgi:hypothetical protein
MLAYRRADIFTHDVLREMEVGFLEDADVFRRRLRAADGTRPEDELAARYRRRNFFGLGQAWVDRFGRNGMPFGHDSFVGPVLRQTRPGQRHGGRLHRQMIRRLAPELAGVPLTKGSTLYPFACPPALAPLYSRVARRPTVTPPAGELHSLREYLFDRIGSSSFRGFVGYDRPRIREMVERCFATGHGKADVDWFLAFDLWRTENRIA